jgi:hypothetical protein
VVVDNSGLSTGVVGWMVDRGGTMVDSQDDAAARARQDPVLFGSDPFAEQPGWSPPGEVAGDDVELPRPKWPMIVGILIVVVVLVGVVGIWVL